MTGNVIPLRATTPAHVFDLEEFRQLNASWVIEFAGVLQDGADEGLDLTNTASCTAWLKQRYRHVAGCARIIERLVDRAAYVAKQNRTTIQMVQF